MGVLSWGQHIAGPEHRQPQKKGVGAVDTAELRSPTVSKAVWGLKVRSWIIGQPAVLFLAWWVGRAGGRYSQDAAPQSVNSPSALWPAISHLPPPRGAHNCPSAGPDSGSRLGGCLPLCSREAGMLTRKPCSSQTDKDPANLPVPLLPPFRKDPANLPAPLHSDHQGPCQVGREWLSCSGSPAACLPSPRYEDKDKSFRGKKGSNWGAERV